MVVETKTRARVARSKPVEIAPELPLGQILIAYAPGGVEAMAAIGLALGYDPAFVAAHHFARILILLVLVPAFLRRTA